MVVPILALNPQAGTLSRSPMGASLLGLGIMNFDFSDDQKLLKEQVRKFLADKCPTKVVRRVLDGNETHAEEVWKGLVDLGVPATGIPEAYGGLGLSPLEVETLVVAMSPHIDAPLSDVFSLLRGSPSRRGVDLSLVAQLYQLRRRDRLQLLDALDPERPLLAWRMIQVISPDSMEGYSSVNYRAIMPTFDVLSALTGRAELAPALAKTSRIVRGEKRLDDLVLSDSLRQKAERLCAMAEQAVQQQQLAFDVDLAQGGWQSAARSERLRRSTL